MLRHRADNYQRTKAGGWVNREKEDASQSKMNTMNGGSLVEITVVCDTLIYCPISMYQEARNLFFT